MTTEAGAASALERMADEANRRIYQEIALRSGGSVESSEDLVLVTGSHSSPVIANVAFRPLDARSGPPPLDVLDRITHHFESVGHGASLMTSERRDADLDAAAAAAGWTQAIVLPVMVAGSPLQLDRREDLVIPWVDPDRDLGSFRDVLTTGFAEDDDERDMLRAAFGSPRSIAPPGVRAVLAISGRVMAGAGAVYRFEGEAAVVGFITVIQSHRNAGIGTRITATLTNAAFEDGASLVALQASPMGHPVYERMGFRTVGRDRIWVAPRSG